ncbi:MAG: hypothetical protein JXA89_01000 [Anaerolineae bacterium]|nr:hypothetical protein [Anaerolineae bacterium]
MLVGVGFSVRFHRSRPRGEPIPVRFAEWGQYDGNCWTALHPMRRERPESMGSVS